MPKAVVQKRHRVHVKAPSGKPEPKIEEPTIADDAHWQLPEPVELDQSYNKETVVSLSNGKKERRVLRRENWLQKMNGINSAWQVSNRKKKQKDLLGAVADMADLSGAIIDAQLEGFSGDQITAVDTKTAKNTKQKAVSQKSRRKESVNEMLRMQQIIGNRSFQANPLQTIKTHLKNTLV
ncbi:hypothetical protein HK100_008422, partial [Physocladia obscura]